MPTSTSPDAALRTLLAPAALRWRCDPSEFAFETTREVEPRPGIVGQEDALEALRFGLEVEASGQNVYVRGLSGSGRLSLVRQLLEEIRPARESGCDRLYVRNFQTPSRPRLISLPAGRGRSLRDAMAQFTDFLRRDFGEALGSEALIARRQLIDERFQARAREQSEPLDAEL